MGSPVEDAATAALEISEVQIGKWTVPIKAKVGAGTAFGLVQLGASDDTQHLAFAAALGVCWENCGKPRWPLRCQYKRMGRRWAEYGNAVIDQFHEKGIPFGEIYAAGAIIWVRIYQQSQLWPTANEVDSAAGN